MKKAMRIGCENMDKAMQKMSRMSAPKMGKKMMVSEKARGGGKKSHMGMK